MAVQAFDRPDVPPDLLIIPLAPQLAFDLTNPGSKLLVCSLPVLLTKSIFNRISGLWGTPENSSYRMLRERLELSFEFTTSIR